MAMIRSKQPLALARSAATIRVKAVPPVMTRRVARDVRMASSSTPSEGTDFDALLNKMADKFEKAENKPAVIGYTAAAVGAVFFSEWLIHLPALDILLGFPIQLIGLFSLPVLGLRYVLDGKDATKDVQEVVAAITTKLPGLKKE